MTAFKKAAKVDVPTPKDVSAHWQKPEIKSLKLLTSTSVLRPLAIGLLLLLVLVILCLYYVPWQQSVTGYGRVVIFSPMDRPQSIEAQIPGRIVKWHVVEGQSVKTGEVIAELEDIDSKFLTNDQVQLLQSQRGYVQGSLGQAAARESALQAQLQDVENSRQVAIPAAEQRARQAEDAVRQAEQNVTQARQSVTTAELNLKRLRELFEKGLRSKRDLELAELEIVTANTRLEGMQAALDVAKKAVQVARFDKDRVVNDTSAQLNSLRASVASVRETIAKTNSDVQKLAVDIGNVQQRSEQRIVRAPRDGKVVRVMKAGPGETVKAGDVMAVLAPATQDQAVELYLSDYDAPLVSEGRQVRLNFAGWPAIQFVGWPSIAVGTFAGRVKVIDAIDDGKSRFRIIVMPDEELIKAGKEEPWPKLDQLRPGAEVNGWVMLDTVSLGFELWRQFNAFPPTVDRGPIGTKKTSGAIQENKPKTADKEGNSNSDEK
ncbi:MAG TPA: HlyD family efflux transporter periplasmic adaptor subunit [Blastocatellia bacterium]|nr:HlyD family efflux transporter periplasmic adaptor subunit [Blastocatellia bacterium]